MHTLPRILKRGICQPRVVSTRLVSSDYGNCRWSNDGALLPSVSSQYITMTHPNIQPAKHQRGVQSSPQPANHPHALAHQELGCLHSASAA
jgi:hypothetical protein